MINPLLDFLEFAPVIAKERDILPHEQPVPGFDTLSLPNRIQLISNEASFRISAGLVEAVTTKFHADKEFYTIDIFLDGNVSGYEKVSQYLPRDFAEFAKEVVGQYAVLYSRFGFFDDGTTGFHENAIWLENENNYILKSDSLSR